MEVELKKILGLDVLTTKIIKKKKKKTGGKKTLDREKTKLLRQHS